MRMNQFAYYCHFDADYPLLLRRQKRSFVTHKQCRTAFGITSNYTAKTQNAVIIRFFWFVGVSTGRTDYLNETEVSQVSAGFSSKYAYTLHVYTIDATQSSTVIL